MSEAPQPPAEEDPTPSARILQWPGPRAHADAAAPAAAPAAAAAPAPPSPGPRRWHGRAVLTPAAAVLAGWALTCLLDHVRPELLDRLVVAAAALTPLSVVPAIAVVALAVRARLWETAGLAALAGVLPWLFVAGYAVVGASPVPAAGSRLDVMLLDADAGRADAPSVAAAVARHPVDVLVLTETTSLLAHELTVAGLDPRLAPRWISLPPGSAQGGIAVYTRYPVVRVDRVPGTRWPAARVTLETGRGSVGLVVGRASPPGQGTDRWRTDLATLGSSARSGEPSVLVGTLDATPEHGAFRRLAGAGLQDAASALGHGLRPTWPSWSPVPMLPLDHVLVGGGVGVRSVGTVAVAGTSHRALLADLAVSSR
jgi:hypothetical protein